jgi:hypothetical protein
MTCLYEEKNPKVVDVKKGFVVVLNHVVISGVVF